MYVVESTRSIVRIILWTRMQEIRSCLSRAMISLRRTAVSDHTAAVAVGYHSSLLPTISVVLLHDDREHRSSRLLTIDETNETGL